MRPFRSIRCGRRSRTMGGVCFLSGVLGLMFVFSGHSTDPDKPSDSGEAGHRAADDTARNYEYSAPFGASGIVGKSFQVAPPILNAMGFPLPQSRLFVLTDATVRDFVVVTGASAHFFHGLYSSLLTVRQFLPEHRIIVYDLGLDTDQITKLKSACKVSVKLFEHEKYPEHVQNLYNYAWKPLIIHEVLREHPGVLWLDSSARIITSNWSSPLSQAVSGTQGALMLTSTGHSNFAVTHPAMYHYLPSDTNSLKVTQQWEANAMLLYRTHQIYSNVIKWWVLCALDKKCIAPTASRFCNFAPNDSYTKYANCHRYDQSAINILLANLFKFDDWGYYAKDRMVQINRRGLEPDVQLDVC